MHGKSCARNVLVRVQLNSEQGIEEENSFLGEIEEMSRFEEKELDKEDGVKYSNE
jgi:hypothetical protein